jgi:hypothetical protein
MTTGTKKCSRQNKAARVSQKLGKEDYDVRKECQNKALRRKCLRISQKLKGPLENQGRDGCPMLKKSCSKLVSETGEKWLRIVTPGIDPEGGQGPAWTVELVEKKGGGAK